MTPGGPPAGVAARAPQRGVWMLPLVGGLVLLVDQLTKVWVQRHFASSYGYTAGQIIVPRWLTLTYTRNRGAAFGLLADKALLFVLIAAVVIGVIIAYVRYLPSGRAWLRLSLSLQLGGALGNLIDRLRQGYVVDFISIKSWPVFNIADTCIVIGVIMLAYYMLVAQAPGAHQSDRAPGTVEGRVPARHLH